LIGGYCRGPLHFSAKHIIGKALEKVLYIPHPFGTRPCRASSAAASTTLGCVATCTVCGFNFDETYGEDYADGYIQIHHIKPLSEYEGEVDPETDLVPLCANCHAMAHRRRPTVTTIGELRALIDEAGG
jgi:predicted HNH restriction endonuclease